MQPFSIVSPLRSPNSLAKALDLWHDAAFPGHVLRPVPGGGQTRQPRHMFVFINPTVRNASSAPDWNYARYPFVGTKPLWRILYRAGWLPVELMQRVEETVVWDRALTRAMHDWLISEGLYFTNLVKRSGHDAVLPNAELVRLFLPYLIEEIKIVQPQSIVTFGLMPFGALSDIKLKLGTHHAAALASGKIADYPFKPIHGLPESMRITPLHFPIGRGNPKPAIELLKLLRRTKA